MDIGTAKPTAEEQRMAPHYLLDVVFPNQAFTAADFQRLADEAVEDIRSRGKLPVLVGGTGLYVDAVLYDFSFKNHENPTLRAELSKLSLQELQARAEAIGIELNRSDWNNPRRLIRAIESGGERPKRGSLPVDIMLVGINPPRAELIKAIEVRMDQMFARGLVEEVRALVRQYGADSEALTGIGYREIIPLLSGKGSQAQAREAIVRDTLQYAKRQLTWFKRNPDIKWFESADSAKAYLIEKLSAPL
jgi:tRNA dimethylallyltransferase